MQPKTTRSIGAPYGKAPIGRWFPQCLLRCRISPSDPRSHGERRCPRASVDELSGSCNGSTFASAQDPAVTRALVRARDRRDPQGSRWRRPRRQSLASGRSPIQSQSLRSCSDWTWATRAIGSLSSTALRCYTLTCDAIRYLLSLVNFPRFPIVDPFPSLYVSRC